MNEKENKSAEDAESRQNADVGTESRQEQEQSAEATSVEEKEVAEEGQGEVTMSFAQYEELKTLARERDEYLQRLQRVVADYQNYQKRQEKMKHRMREQVKRDVVERILPVADHLARALEAAEETEGAEDILEGLRLVESEFHGALRAFDVEPIEAVGREFDPHYHEAAMQEPAGDVPPNTVVRELKKGFTMGEAVIRPAQVSVSARADDEEESEGEDE